MEGSPDSQPTYLPGGRAEALGRFALAGLYPREFNVPAAQARGREEGRRDLASAERSFRKELSELAHAARKAMRKQPGAKLLQAGRVPEEVRADLRFHRDVKAAIDREKDKRDVRKLTGTVRLEVVAEILERKIPGSMSQSRDLIAAVKRREVEEQTAYEWMLDAGRPSLSLYRQALRDIQKGDR